MVPLLTVFPGEIAALSAAGLWAFATVLFGRLGQQLSPLALNLSKGTIAIFLIVVTLALRHQLVVDLPRQSILLLLLSGVVGIGLGDTAYFATVNAMGPQRALLMETLAPPLSAIFALVSLEETLSVAAWGGIGLTLLGIVWVVSERVSRRSLRYLSARTTFKGLNRGILWGILAACGQALGAVLSRAALAGTTVEPLWSTLLRLMAGSLFLFGLMTIRLIRYAKGYSGQPLSAFFSRTESISNTESIRSTVRLIMGVAIAAFLGTYLAIWLQQTALKYAATGVAQSLLATSPIFAIPIALILGERVSLRSGAGCSLALAGVVLLFMN